MWWPIPERGVRIVSVLSKLRTAIRIGPIETLRIYRERGTERRERRVVSRGARWPESTVVASAPGWWPSNAVDIADFQAAHPDAATATIARADRFCAHEFEFLGSGPAFLGERIDWDSDFKSGARWPKQYMADLCIVNPEDASDIKVPWELARHQHFVTLGQAYQLTDDEKYAREFAAQITDWMDGNPPLVGVGWACTMDVALRAISWTWARVLFEGSPSLDTAFWRRVTAGLIAHGEFIIGHLEWGDVRGNHYLSDGAGLAILGLAFPDLPGAREWRQKGLEIVWGELPLQILSDGVDFEASTAYQRLVAELVITPTLVARLSGTDVPRAVWETLERMVAFTAASTRPDGEIAQFGDADDGRVQILSEHTRTHINDHRYLLALGAVLFDRGDLKAQSGGWYAEVEWLLGSASRERFVAIPAEPTATLAVFADGGFVTCRGRRAWLMADCGPVGLAGRGGHGHNDATSFELSYGEVPVILDPGTYVYGADPAARNRMRSTLSHNVTVLDGQEMADFGDLWSIADDARAELREAVEESDSFRVLGAHHGYERLANPVTVIREFALDGESGTLVVTDELTGTGEHSTETVFHTSLEVSVVDRNQIVLMNQGRVIARVTASFPGAPFVETCWLSPSYGVRYAGSRFGWRVTELSVPARLSVTIEEVGE